jgi:sec-independent protein translocase protein TatC
MEAELDLADADRPSESTPRQANASDSRARTINSVEEKIMRANRLRELHNDFAARQVLYEVLEEGDTDQRRIARNILQQLDHV